MGFEDITDITPIVGLKKLTLLDLEGNNLNNDSLMPIAELTNLVVLALDENLISDLTPLAKLTNLKVLALSITSITDLTPLTGLTNLESLDLGENRISDINPLVSNTGLGIGDSINLGA